MPSRAVADIMTRSVLTLPLTIDIYDAVRTMLKHKISGAPVVDENQKLVGVLSEKDCLKVLVGAALEGLPEGRVSDYMTRDVETIAPSSSLYEVVHRFISRPYRRFSVVDDTGRVIGQVSRRDAGCSGRPATFHLSSTNSSSIGLRKLQPWWPESTNELSGKLGAVQLLSVRHERRASARRDGRRFRHADRPGQETVSMLRLVGVLALASCIGGCAATVESPGSHTFQGPTMGTTFAVKVVGDLDDVQVARLRSSIEHILAQIDATMSTYRADSEVTRFNRLQTTEPFLVSRDTLTVFQHAIQMSELTGGAFDVTVGPLVDAWGFGPRGRPAAFPTPAELERLLGRVGYRKLEVDVAASTIRKLDSRLSCDLSALAKGFAVDRVADLLGAEGVAGYLVEIGGEIRTFGRSERSRLWRVGIERPGSGILAVHRLLALDDLALATSGDYRNYYEVDGRQISHAIDPRTGRPVSHGLASVSVIAATCVQADAIATALEVMGLEEGYALAVERGWAALMVGRRQDGTLYDRETPAFVELAIDVVS